MLGLAILGLAILGLAIFTLRISSSGAPFGLFLSVGFGRAQHNLRCLGVFWGGTGGLGRVVEK